LTASLPLYAVRLGADDAALGLMAGVISLVSLAGRPWAGAWIDAGGSVPALLTGGVVFAVCAAGYWLASSVAILLAFRALTGVSVALFTTSGQTLAVNLSPPQRRGEAYSLYSITYPLAQIFGPPAGVIVTRVTGYPGLFAVCIAVCLAGAVMAWPLRAVRQGARGSTRRRLLNRLVLTPGVWMLMLMVAFGANIALLAVHASRRGVANPGVVFTAQAMGLLVALLLIYRLSDRIGRMAIVLPGMALAALGMWATALSSGWTLVLAGALSGAGLGAAQPMLFALGADMVPPEERGSAMATLGVFLEIGIGIGAIGGGIVGRAFGLEMMFGLAGLSPALGAALVFAQARLTHRVTS